MFCGVLRFSGIPLYREGVLCGMRNFQKVYFAVALIAESAESAINIRYDGNLIALPLLCYKLAPME